MRFLDLIDARIAELDRLSAAASDGEELKLLLLALRALRRHKVAGVPPQATPPPRRGAHGVADCARVDERSGYLRLARGAEAASKPGVAPAISRLTSIPGATAS